MHPDNDYIADQFSQLSKLMDIHGENSFKAKSYAVASYTIEKYPEQLADMPQEKLFMIKGIGDAIAKKIIEIIETGELSLLQKLLQQTPPGVVEMLLIKGIGPKKISVIWKEMEIESLGELLYACNENRLTLYKGFGEKTQKNVKEAIEFYFKNQDSNLFAEVEQYAQELDQRLKKAFPDKEFALAGEVKRQLETIRQLEWVTTASAKECIHFFTLNGFEQLAGQQDILAFKQPDCLPVLLHLTTENKFYTTAVQKSSSPEFAQAFIQRAGSETEGASSEKAVFSQLHLPYIPAPLREHASILDAPPTAFIEPTDIKGIIHCHSNWSDGSNTLEELVEACKARKLEYLVISDHSKSAFYANGLDENRTAAQQAAVDALNKKTAPFKIFKSIECDILNDGKLDYADDVLSTFDLVIASVHSNLKMIEEKANQRLLKAIENPYTTILGHMTGRLLLSRKGYPVDHKKIIDACAANKVVIELNAHPRRLDIDWRWIDYALQKGVLISIDPDSHVTSGFDDTRYGVLVAQKAGLTKENNLSSFSLQELEEYLLKRKKEKGI
ncbi:MAG: DNA polymerase/3'-5' exonuclease PolX [Williamsia sp.]|nr:DNA polymerase/3'-5' exonuclease PolX [Williamsia sp.]